MTKLFAAIRARLIDDWRDLTRFWSVRMTMIGGLLAALLTAMPALPPEVQAVLPVKYRVAAVALWSIAGIVTRVIKQPKLGG